VLRVQDAPPMDVMAIDNLPSLLPVEASHDYAAQLLPSLLTLDRLDRGVWARAEATYKSHMTEV
jgi:saccharopine dehydrogenase (NAD+, L-lysine-forming)